MLGYLLLTCPTNAVGPPYFYHKIHLYWFVTPTYKIVPAPLSIPYN